MAKTKANISTKLDYIWGFLRISLGLTFLWAYFDKLIGLGFSTCKAANGSIETMCDASWLQGGSPTTGFLSHTTGPFADIYQNMANNSLIDWLFMLALLGIGLGLTLGIAVRLSTFSGAILLLMLYVAVLPLENNPILDEHIIYSIALAGIFIANSTQRLGFRKQWMNMSFVKKMPILE